jgi:hypothetical protein
MPGTPTRTRAAGPRILDNVLITRRWAAFLIGVGVWTWLIWPRFAVAIVRDDRSFSAGAPTAFLIVHVLLIAASLAIGTTVGGLGVKAWRASTRTEESAAVGAPKPKD